MSIPRKTRPASKKKKKLEVTQPITSILLDGPVALDGSRAFAKKDLYLLELSQLRIRQVDTELRAQDLALAKFIQDAQDQIKKAQELMASLQATKNRHISELGSLYREIERVYLVDMRSIEYDAVSGVIASTK